MLELKRYAGAFALALIACFVVTAEAKAACTVKSGQTVSNDEKAWPGNAVHEALRNAYADGRCEITKGMHPGGTPCVRGKSDNHITVAQYTANGYLSHTFHVFGYKVMVDGVERQCSTR
jgi:hypothetical protein